MDQQNPWWRGGTSYVVEMWEEMPLRWFPRWIDSIPRKPYALNFIMGPRQIGKTTGIHLLIQRLLKAGVEPERVFYFDLDLAFDLTQMKKILDTYLNFRRASGYDSSFIFLDEVTSVNEWWKVIKGFIDLGLFRNDVVTLTGSSSLALKGEVELFPGRRGEGQDIKVYPLSFREFLGVNGVKVKFSGDLERDFQSALPVMGDVKNLFPRYLQVGGFPLSINEDPRAQEYYIKSIEGELLRWGKNMQIVRGTLSSILRKAPSPLSYSAIAGDIGVSYKTVQEYLGLFSGLHILDLALHREGTRVSWRKEKKIFFLDPFIANSISLWTGTKYLDSALYEWIVQSHLLRRFGEVYYYRDAYEVDCIANSLKIEVKAEKPHRKYPKDVKVLGKEEIPGFLAAVV